MPTELCGKRVLIVDDTPVNREIFQVLTKSWGLRPAEAADGLAALEALTQAQADQDPFDLAILDMQMPGMDGKTLGRAIKADPSLQATRLVMCTSLGQTGSDQQWEKIGFVAAITKPVRRQELYEVLEAAIAGRKPAIYSARTTLPLALDSSFSQARILVADDNITNQQVALGILKKLGLRAEVAANGLEVLQALKTIPYDLGLMDVQMPEMDGYEATRKIRDPQSRVHNHQVPIIAMTAHALSGDREKSLAAGMNDYITKPVEVAALVAALKKWLSPNAGSGPLLAGEPVAEAAAANHAESAVVFDRAGLMERVLDDEELVGVIMTAFLGDMPQQLQQLKLAVAAGDALAVESQAHQIKGAAATVGGIALSALAGVLEQAGRAGDLTVISARATEMDAQFEALKAAMNPAT